LQNEQEQNALSSALQTPTATQGLSSYAPLIGPPPPITAAQQKQLNDLLLLYEADRISPEQYHDRRAKILGQK
ncbi:MAG TPA: hypothetical protein VKA67_14095, partial [Verrucomicrobiae bacterium]|nr:hypothetical protein [Verrucomicrobiae bacterium]